MNVDIYEKYYDYKLKTIYQYSVILSKVLDVENNKLWKRKRELEKSLKEIINNYTERLRNNNPLEKTLVRCFINDKEISKYNIDRELMSVIDYFEKEEKAFEIKAYEKEIILAAIIIHIANNLDVMTSPYSINKNNYKTVVHSQISKFTKLEYIKMIDDIGNNVKILLELVKTNIRKEHRLFELLNNSKSFNKYVDISYENKYYLTQYNYSIPKLKTLEKGAGAYIHKKDQIDNKFSLISADLIVSTIMKLTSVRKYNKIFYLPLKREFLESDEDLNKIATINHNEYLNRSIRVLVNYNDAEGKILKKLDDRKIKYAIYCNKATEVEINDEAFKHYDYLVSKDFYDKYTELIDSRNKEYNNIVVEAFDGMVNDRIIAEEG